MTSVAANTVATLFFIKTSFLIKFRCDASGNKDDVYIDEVVVSVVVKQP